MTYVKTVATGAGTGASWADAAGNVQAGIDTAVSQSIAVRSCEVWLAEGTYHIYETARTDTVQLAYGIPLYGGFAGAETARQERDCISGSRSLGNEARLGGIWSHGGALHSDRRRSRQGGA